MKLKLSIACLAALMVVIAPSMAQSADLHFTYTFSSSRVISGDFQGTLQGDGDSFFVSSASNVVYNGTTLPVDPTDICSLNDFNSCAQQPQVSLSGLFANQNIFVCAQGFSGGNCSFAGEGGFYFGIYGAAAGDGLDTTDFEGYQQERWNASTTSTPEPATYASLLGGLGLLGFVARRKKAFNV